MSKVKIVLNNAGIRELMKSKEIVATEEQIAGQIASRAGNGYSVGTRSYPERTGVAVFPETKEAIHDNIKNNTLLKALGR